MLFDTVAEYQAEIAEVRTYLKAGLDRKSYEYTSGGPGSGAAEGWSRDPASALAYLKMLTDELRQLEIQTQGLTNLVKFQRPV